MSFTKGAPKPFLAELKRQWDESGGGTLLADNTGGGFVICGRSGSSAELRFQLDSLVQRSRKFQVL